MQSLIVFSFPSDSEGEDKSSTTTESDEGKKESSAFRDGAMRCVAVLPGMGVYSYTDSSDSKEDSDSDSDLDAVSGRDLILRDITGRVVHYHGDVVGKRCC